MSKRILTCVYCGMEYPQNTPAWGSKVLTDHIKICPKHPMREAEKKIEMLLDERDMLRGWLIIVKDFIDPNKDPSEISNKDMTKYLSEALLKNARKHFEFLKSLCDEDLVRERKTKKINILFKMEDNRLFHVTLEG